MSTKITKLTVKDKATLTMNNKRERSPSPESSNSSVFSFEAKRMKKLDYLRGPGKKEWVIRKKLMVNDVDVATALAAFRKKKREISRKKAHSLSHIFPYDKYNPYKCITDYIKKREAEAIKTCYENNKSKLPRSSVSAVMYCKNLIDVSYELIQMNKQLTLSMTRVLRSKRKTPKQIYAVYMFTVLSRIDAYYHGSKPDMLLGVERKRRAYYFFFVEVKRPNQTSKYQPEDDMVKLMKQMKHSIDDQLYLGVKTPKSFGLLIEGFNCSFYKMVVLEEGIYFPMMMKSFRLVKHIHDLMQIPAMVECLTLVKVDATSKSTLFNILTLTFCRMNGKSLKRQ
ncbi:hypothetical protein BD560DRAFT_474677 [Blakeslea trispora]|nr:hypothetical protein BD560DRAFT_474677 [Blakeslea trispora]